LELLSEQPLGVDCIFTPTPHHQSHQMLLFLVQVELLLQQQLVSLELYTID
jgi:hypothetical protein